MPAIEPTHTCFDDALEFFELLRLSEPEVQSYVRESLCIAHGICESASGERWVHAWVEEIRDDDPDRADWPRHVVWQGMRCGSGKGWFAVGAEWFYTAFRVQERELYRVEQFGMLNLLSGHYGPWNPRYLAMMGGGGRVLGTVEGASPLGFVLPDGAPDPV